MEASSEPLIDSGIGARIKRLRYVQGMGPDTLATRAGISRTSLYQLECGHTSTPRARTLSRLASALGVTPARLMGSEDDPATKPEYTHVPPDPDVNQMALDQLRILLCGRFAVAARNMVGDLYTVHLSLAGPTDTPANPG